MVKHNPGAILGASDSIITGQIEWPMHGLRHPPADGSSGWFVWFGEWSDAGDFFKPWHQAHFEDRWPGFSHLLELSPGSRFLVAPGHEDVWRDESLLEA